MQIAQPPRDRAHQRPLRPIAIAAAAEHGDQPAACERPRRLEQVAQRVVGVRVVDDHRDFVFRARDDLKPAGHAVERLAARVRSRRTARRARSPSRRPRECCKRSGRPTSFGRTCSVPRGVRTSNASPCERKRQRTRRDVGGAVDRVGDRPAASVRRAPPPRGSSRFSRLGASRGSISNSRRFARKYSSMSAWKSRWSRVRFVNTAGGKRHPVHASQRQRVRRHFHRARAAAASTISRSKRLHVRRLRRRARRLARRSSPMR